MNRTLIAAGWMAAWTLAGAAWSQSSAPKSPAQAAAQATAACTPPWPNARSLTGAGVVMNWRTVQEALGTGRHFSVEVALCPDAAGAFPELLKVDATMPEHRHGMNYRPTLAATGPGRYRADGLLLHMPGRWEFAFELRAPGSRPDAAPLRLAQSLVVR